ncbi:MAG: putative regulatory protein and domain [Frankiales bacterium]|nr:putative regulatory protein and domain [Frankiales bacterium]
MRDDAVPTGGPEAHAAVFEHGMDGVLYTVPHGRILSASPAAARLLGASPEEICARGRAGWIDATDERWATLIEERERTGHAHGVARMCRADGSTFHAELVSDVFEVHGNARASIVFRDVSEQVAAVEALARAERQWRLTFDSAPTGIGLVATDGRWIAVNAALARILGYAVEDLLGTRFREITHADDRDADILAFGELVSGRILRYSREKRCIHKDGTHVWVKVSVGLVRGERDEPLHLVSHVEDVTAERERRQRLSDLAWLDPLTRLVNRGRFLEVVRAIPAGETFAVLFLDLDNFKEVNDRLGHAAGDELLLAAAKRVTSEMRPDDVAARLGGDEFAVALRNLTTRDEAVAVGERIREALAAHYNLSHGPASVTCSVGIAIATSDRNPEALLVAADVAMYNAKRSGRNACHLSA